MLCIFWINAKHSLIEWCHTLHLIQLEKIMQERMTSYVQNATRQPLSMGPRIKPWSNSVCFSHSCYIAQMDKFPSVPIIFWLLFLAQFSAKNLGFFSRRVSQGKRPTWPPTKQILSSLFNGLLFFLIWFVQNDCFLSDLCTFHMICTVVYLFVFFDINKKSLDL